MRRVLVGAVVSGALLLTGCTYAPTTHLPVITHQPHHQPDPPHGGTQAPDYGTVEVGMSEHDVVKYMLGDSYTIVRDAEFNGGQSIRILQWSTGPTPGDFIQISFVDGSVTKVEQFGAAR